MANGVQKVSLAKPRVAIDKQRVVGLGWALGNGKGSCSSENIGRTHDEVFEGVLRVES